MIEFPSSASVRRILPKEAFYRNLSLSQELKDRFVTDVSRIAVEYKLAPGTFNAVDGARVHEILILTIDLKKKDFDNRIVECITKQNPHKLVFLIRFDGMAQLALLYFKLYRTEWMPEDALSLTARGGTLDAVWEDFVAQVALGSDAPDMPGLTLEERLERRDAIDRLEKEVEKLMRSVQKEAQPRKKFELHTRLIAKRRELVRLKGE